MFISHLVSKKKSETRYNNKEDGKKQKLTRWAVNCQRFANMIYPDTHAHQN